MEMRFEDILKLRKALEMAKVDYDGEKPEEKEAAEYLEKHFYPSLVEVIKKVIEAK